MKPSKSSTAGFSFLVVALGLVASALPPVIDVEETIGLGWLFTVRGPIEPPPEVAIVAISGESAEKFGVSRDVDEWPRALHADLISRLRHAGAAVIAFDIIFEVPRDNDPDGDARLAEEIAEAGNVLLAERVSEIDEGVLIGEKRVRPIETFRNGALATAPFILPLVPARVGQSWTFGRVDGAPSLPAAVLHAYALPLHGKFAAMLAGARSDLVDDIGPIGAQAIRENGLQDVMRRLRNVFLRDPALAEEIERRIVDEAEDDTTDGDLLRAMLALYSGGNGRYLNFYGPAGTIETIPFHEVLEADSAALRQSIRGRAVFVGFFERRRSEQQDYFDSVFSERTGQRLSGVEIGATAFANLLHLDSVKPLPVAARLILVAVWGVLVAVLSRSLRGFAAAGVVVGTGVLLAAAAQLVFEVHGLWSPLVVPLGVQLPIALVVGLSWNHAVLRRQRERVQAALGYYVPAGVVNRLAAETTLPRGGREVVYGTCLVTDAEQYTTLSESLRPEELGALMDSYYERLVDAVDRHGGVVSDIGGDSMVVVWPTVGSHESTRLAANRGALAVLAAVEVFNRERAFRELPTRIGVDSGQLLLGNVGARARGEYRAVGDIVNTASRLQGLNRLLGTRILVSASAAAPEAASEELSYRPLGEFLLVGKRTPVAVQELRTVPDDPKPDDVLELEEAFAKALAMFRSGDWSAAEAAFAAVAERFPGDGPTRFFKAQCRLLATRFPDGEGWDGVVRVTTK